MTSVPEWSISVQRALLQFKVMIAAYAKDQVKFLPAEPVVYTLKFIVITAEHIEHVAAVNQHLAAEDTKFFLFAVRIADDGQSHAQPFSSLAIRIGAV